MPADFANDLILVTCASGKQGTDLVPLLSKQWKRLRLQVRSDASAERLRKQFPNAEVVQADLDDPSSAPKLLEGVTAAYLVGPAFSADETLVIKTFIASAQHQRSSGGPFAHLIYSSVLHPILRKLLNHDAKRYAEEYLTESQLPHTILQPSHVMENFPMAKVLSEDTPTYPIPYNPETVFTWTSTRDVAAAAARVLEERERHFYATYQLVSTEPGNYRDAVKIIGDVIGKEVRIERIGLLEAAEMMASRMGGGTDEAKRVARRLLLYYDESGLIGNRNVLEWLIGRKPLSYEEWAKIKVEEVRAQMGK